MLSTSQYNFIIKTIIVHSDEFEVHTKTELEKFGEIVKSDEVYFLRFSPRLNWSPYEAVSKIAKYMSTRTGNDRKILGKYIRNMLLHITEDEFIKRIYTFWKASRYVDRIGIKGPYRIWAKSKIHLFKEIKNIRLKMAFGQALFRMEGKKRSDKAYYWLGDFNNTKIKLSFESEDRTQVKLVKTIPEEYYRLGIASLNIGMQRSSEEHLVRACQYFEKAINLKKDYAEAYCYWGKALYNLAQIRMSNKLYISSLNKFAIAVKYKKNLYEAHHSIGLILSHFSIKENNSYLNKKSIDKYKLAIKYKKDFSEAYFNWALALVRIAAKEENVELLIKSCEKYKLAIKYNNKFSTAYMNLGNNLIRLCELTNDEDFIKDGIRNFELAITHDNYSPEKYYNLAISLLFYSHNFKKTNLSNRIIELLFTSFLLSILQTNLDFAIYVADSYLLNLSKNSENELIYILTYTFNEMIILIQRKEKPKHAFIEYLNDKKGLSTELRIINNALLNKKIEENLSKKEQNCLSTETAIYLAKQIIKKV